jgi:hypothetical protein
VTVLVDMLWLGGFVLAIVVLGCALLVWGMVAIGRISDEHRLPPVDDTYVVTDEPEDWDAHGDPDEPGPAPHLPDSPRVSGKPGAGSGEPPDDHQAV